MKLLSMKVVRNESLQGHMVYFKTSRGIKGFWFAPGKRLAVPAAFISKHIVSLQKRKLLSVKEA